MSPQSISSAVRRRVRTAARNRWGYCQSSQRYVLGLLEIDHILPKAHGGSDDESNLWLACRMCNSFKGTQITARDPLRGRRVRLFNPRRQRWARHFYWSEDGTRIIGRTSCGRATVAALQLNHVIAVIVRREWVAAGWHPPSD
ncbi:HNH endonuclease [Candidatus Entotheonella palauensis]|uniref:HNH endonuclease n=1 Tax=Candidatus Entotheonella palauensis TaxID=93172 RepID=UPI000B7EC3FA|nr:HNH endonuclease [Candidatus Entotheonella palauensis]